MLSKLIKLRENRVIDFVCKNRIYFVIALISLFLFLSGFWYPFYIFAVSIAIIFYLTSKPCDIVCLMMFSELFSVVQHYFMIGQIAGLVSLLIRFIVDVVKKRKKVAVLPLALTVFILVLYSCIHYQMSESGTLQGLNIICVLLGLYLVFVMNKDIDVNRAIDFIALGIALSGLLSAITLAIPNYAFDVAPFDGTYDRVRLFTYHTNYLSMLCLFLIAFTINKLCNKKGKLVLNLLEIVLALVVGILTLSKAFIIVCVGFVGYVVILLIIKYKKKSFRIIIPIIICLGVLCLIFNEFVADLLSRFFAYNKGNSLINQITTGRSAIWQAYIDDIRSSLAKMLFGVGLFSADIYEIGPHNSYIFILHRFGFIGVILLGLLAYSYIKAMNTKFDIKFKKLLPLFTFLVLSLEEMIVSDRFFIFLAFAIMVLLKSENQEKVDKDYAKLSNVINKN